MKKLALVLFIFPIFTLANKKAEISAKQRVMMQFIADDMMKLQLFARSESEFLDKKNKSRIANLLTKLHQHASDMRKHKTFDSDLSTRTTVAMLTHHLAETRKYFQEEQSRKFARTMLQSSLNLCSSCHTRFKRNVEINFLSVKDRKKYGIRAFDRAQFFFALRNYDLAIKEFDSLIKGYPKNGATIFEISEAFKSLSHYYVRVSEDRKKAIYNFRRYQKRKNLPKYLAKRIGLWVDSLERWKKAEKNLKKDFTAKEAIAKAKNLVDYSAKTHTVRIEDENYIGALYATHVLHMALDKTKKTTEHGDILHLLGMIYQQLESQLFFNFEEAYFENCIREFPNTKQSKRCYISLQEAIESGYTGSAGTMIPDDVAKRLKELRKLAF